MIERGATSAIGSVTTSAFGLVEGPVIAVRHQDALAAELVVRRELLALDGVLHLTLEILEAGALEDLSEALVGDGAVDHELEVPVEDPAVRPLEEGKAPVDAPLELGDVAVELGEDPRCGALVEVELLDVARNLWDELDGRRAGADDGDALALEVHGVVPLGGVEGGALEALEALKVRLRGNVEAADAGDEEAGGELLLAVRSLADAVPQAGGLVPLSRDGAEAETEVRADAVLVGHAFEVVADLLLGRVHLGPVRVLLERERVHMRRDITGAAGIGVLAPGARDRVGLVEDDEVLDARLLELDRCSDA